MIKKKLSRNDLLSDFAKRTLKDRYLLENEDYQDMFARVAKAYSNDEDHAQRLYDYMSTFWFMPATPILSNGGSGRGLPISCFLNVIQDDLRSISNKWHENVWLASKGGGIGTSWNRVRSMNEPIKKSGKTSGVISFIKVQDSLTLAISQGSLRRGSAAVYLNVEHPEIIEFLEMRKPSGGDINRKALNIHHGVVISDDFMKAVEQDLIWELKSPKTKEVLDSIKARELWARLLTVRIDTGEPYFLFIDNVNRAIHPAHKKLGLNVEMSNLCSEITLFAGIDHLQKDRTAVCCLSSLNLEKYDEWKDDERFIKDVMYFLDNVIEDFIKRAPEEMKSAIYSASRERSVGLGVMGFHFYLQGKNIPFDSLIAKVYNKNIFKNIHKKTIKVCKEITEERGSCPDAIEAGLQDRFINKLSIAPTASISIICGQTSPSVEPIVANAYISKTLSGSFPIKNRYLDRLIKNKNLNSEEVWRDILSHNGSIQNLDYFSREEKEVFKISYEIDQRSIVDMAADRTPYICQAQSINLFFYADVHKSYLHEVHYRAWRQGVKSLYYSRSLSLQRAENIGKSVKSLQLSLKNESNDENKYDECLSCQ